MSTEAIRNYFGLKYPVRIEWLNDSSCNIVLKDKDIAGQLVEDFTRRDLPKTETMKDEADESTARAIQCGMSSNRTRWRVFSVACTLE
jgi:hypothetical protein